MTEHPRKARRANARPGRADLALEPGRESTGAATIYEVAAAAKVSIKTVSRVLNGETGASEATRARVREAMQVLHYRPDPSARALASARSHLLAILFDNPNSDYIYAIQRGASEACRRAGHHLIAEPLDVEARNLRSVVQTLLTRSRPDGVILTPPVSDSAEVLAALAAAKIPHVSIAPRTGTEDDIVGIDDRAAAVAMTRRLLELGHRRIGFISGHARHASARLRYEGFIHTVRDAGLPPDAVMVEPGEFSFLSGAQAAHALLTRPHPPTAIFASNDNMALGVMSVASRLQLAVPDDLSICGFDDTSVCQMMWPQLTTIRQPLELMAEAAVEMLVGTGGRRPAGRTFDFELIVRGTLGPPPAR